MAQPPAQSQRRRIYGPEGDKHALSSCCSFCASHIDRIFPAADASKHSAFVGITGRVDDCVVQRLDSEKSQSKGNNEGVTLVFYGEI